MQGAKVAAISRDADVRLELARAFDAAPSTWDVALYESVPPDADVVVRGPDVDDEADIVFDPEHPERVVPAVREALRDSGGSNLVVVTSPGGGTGATSVALHLAQVAARTHDVCCIDRPGGAMRLRLDLPDDVPSYSDAPIGGDVKLVAPPVPGGFRVLLSDRGDDCDLEVLAAAKATFEIVIAERSHLSLGDIKRARAAILVIAPTIPSARRAAAIIEACPAARWAVVANRLGPGGHATRPMLEAAVGAPLAIELPTSPALRDAEDRGRLVDSPLSRWLLGIRRLWRAVERR